MEIVTGHVVLYAGARKTRGKVCNRTDDESEECTREDVNLLNPARLGVDVFLRYIRGVAALTLWSCSRAPAKASSDSLDGTVTTFSGSDWDAALEYVTGSGETTAINPLPGSCRVLSANCKSSSVDSESVKDIDKTKKARFTV